jgi:DeoR family suf operon transcriptional repressor
MNQTATLASMPTTRREILTMLKERGGARAEELAAALGITVSAIRQHLSALDANGLVTHREVKGGPGRPKFIFHLAAAAEALFPQAYSELANELLDLFEEEDPRLTNRVLGKLCEKTRVAAAARVDDLLPAERPQAVLRMFEARGFLPKLEELPGGGYRFILANCPVVEVARRHSRVCDCEVGILDVAFPGANIVHTEGMRGGGHACVYECTPANGKRTLTD